MPNLCGKRCAYETNGLENDAENHGELSSKFTYYGGDDWCYKLWALKSEVILNTEHPKQHRDT
jgi:hypothetical protein